MRYTLNQIFLAGSGRFCLPLPKLNDEQVGLVAERLRSRGFQVKVTEGLHARIGGQRIRVHRAGVAWSNRDLLDPLAPLVPALLAAKKTEVDENPYYLARRRGDLVSLQLLVRMESSETWSELRREDLCGLTPDEAVVVTSLLGRTRGKVRGVTDYPRKGGKMMRLGRKVYFESAIGADEMIANLSVMGKDRDMNAFLPRNSVIEIPREEIPSELRAREIVDSMGEWCYLTLGASKTSNVRI